jgi:hypothetical protein
MLLEHENVDVHIKNKAGSTALDIARNLGTIEMTKCLEKHVMVSLRCDKSSENPKRKREKSEKCSKKICR